MAQEGNSNSLNVNTLVDTKVDLEISNNWIYFYNGIFKRKDKGKDPREVLFDKIPSQIILPNKTSVVGKRVTEIGQLLQVSDSARKKIAEEPTEDGTISLTNPPLVLLPSATSEKDLKLLLRLYYISVGLLSLFSLINIAGTAIYSGNISLIVLQGIVLFGNAVSILGIFRQRMVLFSTGLCFQYMQSVYFLVLLSKPIDIFLGFFGLASFYIGRRYREKAGVSFFRPAIPS
ncbi:hypothetical protein MP638_003236 [Amoeboaphelidium occidentale]|nr:hypothetical protein MP638_003236 [Amoeboaphelidium occidentale]